MACVTVALRRWSARLALAAALAATGAAGPAAADADAPERYCHAAWDDPRAGAKLCVSAGADYAAELCGALEHYALRHDLPPGFFARLIWRESLFDPAAVSPKGAQGVAQFMPATARREGLQNPFNPVEALSASARHLSDLRAALGNLGLAAAGYNAGLGRAADLRDKGRGLPGETRRYVAAITGHPAQAWRAAPFPEPDYALAESGGFQPACRALAETRRLRRFEGPGPAWRPWGAQVAVGRSEGAATRLYRRLQTRYPAILSEEEIQLVWARVPGGGPRARAAARIGRDTRGEARALCRRLRAAGGYCIVRRNP